MKGHNRVVAAFLLYCSGCASRTPQATEVQAAEQAKRADPAPVSAQLLQGLRGLAGAYTDASYLTASDFGQHPHWRQPWRSFLETVPARHFLDGIGIGLNVVVIKTAGLSGPVSD